MLDKKTLKFFDDLTLDSMPITGKLYDAIANFIKVERVSDEKDFENDKLAFTIQIREYEDSLIKIECDNLINEDTNHVVVYNMIDGELVNVMEDNENYRKYYGRSLSRKYNGWINYLSKGGVFSELGEEFRFGLERVIKHAVNLYISKSLNFYNDPFFIFNNVSLKDFSNEDGLSGLLKRKLSNMDVMYNNHLMFDINYGTMRDYTYDYIPTHLITDDNAADYIIETLLRMMDFRNAAVIEKINRSRSIILRDVNKIGIASVMCTSCVINNDIEYFKQITKVYLSVYRNYNLIDESMMSLFKILIGIVLNISDYKDYIDSVLYGDFISCENTGVSNYGKCDQYINDMRITKINGSDFIKVRQSLEERIAYDTLNPKNLVKFDRLRDDYKGVVYKCINDNCSIINLYGIELKDDILRISDLINRLELYFITELTVRENGGRIHELYKPLRLFRR